MAIVLAAGVLLSAAPPGSPGTPVLVVTSAANPFTNYYTEILRTEGLNSFQVLDVTAVSAATLAQYDVVVLGEMPITSVQADMFAAWVTAGGNLIAMRPDKKLAGLLGLTDAAATRAAYCTEMEADMRGWRDMGWMRM